MKKFLIRLVLFPFRRLVLLKRLLSIKIYGYKVTSNLQKICEQFSIICWIDYGTLLGFIRNQAFLSWDTDIDIGIYVENQHELKNFINLLINSKKMKCVCVGKLVETGSLVKVKLVRLGVIIDISVYYNSGKDLTNKFTYLETQEGWKKKRSKISQFKQIFVKGYRFNIPLNANEYLSDHYGEDFMIPNNKWNDLDSKDIDFQNEKVELVYKRIESL